MRPHAPATYLPSPRDECQPHLPAGAPRLKPSAAMSRAPGGRVTECKLVLVRPTPCHTCTQTGHLRRLSVRAARRQQRGKKLARAAVRQESVQHRAVHHSWRSIPAAGRPSGRLRGQDTVWDLGHGRVGALQGARTHGAPPCHTLGPRGRSLGGLAHRAHDV
jgi:hypothetical protein